MFRWLQIEETWNLDARCYFIIVVHCLSKWSHHYHFLLFKVRFSWAKYNFNLVSVSACVSPKFNSFMMVGKQHIEFPRIYCMYFCVCTFQKWWCLHILAHAGQCRFPTHCACYGRELSFVCCLGEDSHFWHSLLDSTVNCAGRHFPVLGKKSALGLRELYFSVISNYHLIHLLVLGWWQTHLQTKQMYYIAQIHFLNSDSGFSFVCNGREKSWGTWLSTGPRPILPTWTSGACLVPVI